MDFLENYEPMDEGENVIKILPLHVFFKTDPNLSPKSLAQIVLSAFFMGYSEKTRDTIEDGDYFAFIKKGDYTRLGAFIGRQYTAQVITEKGVSDIGFLLHEPAKARWN